MTSHDVCDAGLRWFAIWTRSRQEKAAASTLESLGVSHFLPLRTEIRQWSDRTKAIETPLFGGYLFVRMNLSKDSKLWVLKTPGVVGFVGNSSGPLPIPDEQIENIRTLLSSGLDYSVCPILQEGDRVRVIRGALSGVEGTLLRKNSDAWLVISVEMIKQSITVSVSKYDVEPIAERAA